MMAPLFGWLALTALVVTYDVWAIRTHHDTMSKGFWRGVHSPTLRWVVVPAWALLTIHLFTGLP